MKLYKNFAQGKPLLDARNGFSDIHVSYYEDVAVVRMVHGKTNSLNKGSISQLYRCLTTLFNDELVKAVVLSSGLRFAFSSGLDLSEALKCRQRDKIGNYLVRQAQLFFLVANRIFKANKPVVAAIGGVTLGLGVQLASVCDFRICSELAWFSIPEMAVGGVYPTVPLLQNIGLKNVKTMLLFGEKINSEGAMEIGLVDRIVSHREVEREAINLAKELSLIDEVSLNLQRNLLRNRLHGLMKDDMRDLIRYLRRAVNREKVINGLIRLRDTGNIMEFAK
jgi:enoyl-CoA hydratase/carnithine racemase